MDAYTQNLRERTRQRREILEKKLAETSPRRKRTVPLGEYQDENIAPPVDDDSPKRQCMWETGNGLKPDTPAIQSVRTRLTNLSTQKTLRNGDEENMDTEYIPPVRRHGLEVDIASPPPQMSTARKSRLAALANTINNWEDDLSHVAAKKDEKPKNAWQPPKPVEPQMTSTASPVKPSRGPPITISNTNDNSVPSKPPRIYAYGDNNSDQGMKSASPVKFSPSKIVASNSSPVKWSPAKPPRQKSPNLDSNKPAVATLTVQLGSAVKPKENSLAVPRNAIPKPPRQRSPLFHEECPDREDTQPAPAASIMNETISDPITKPVSARMAAWQKKSVKPDDDKEPTKQPVSARQALWEQKVEASKKETHITTPQVLKTRTPVTARVHPARDNSESQDEPTKKSVHSRMAAWETKINHEAAATAAHNNLQYHNMGKTGATPRAMSSQAFKDQLERGANDFSERRASPAKKPVTSPLKSPSKVGMATKTIHQRLQQVSGSWQRNDISEKIQQQKAADLDVLQNRWKNGMLKDSDNENECPRASAEPASQPEPVRTPGPQTPAAPPAPPPLPTPPGVSPAKKPVSQKRQVAREKIRNDDICNNQTDQDRKGNGFQPHFESKLKTMGFDIHSVTDLGHVASADIPKTPKTIPKPSTPASSKLQITERVITTTKFGEDKVEVKRNQYEVPLDVNNKAITLTTTIKEPQDTPTFRSTCSAKVNVNTTPKTPGTSIYSLIRKTPGPTPGSNPSLQQRAAPAPVGGSTEDSFDSAESSFESSPEETDRESEAPVRQLPLQNNGGVRRKESTSSARSTTSSTYSESQTDYTGDNTEDYTEDTASQYTEDTGSQYSDEDSQDYSDESEGEAVDDLLDEAMDDDTTTMDDTETESVSSMPVPAPRHKMSSHSSQSKIRDNSSLRRHQEARNAVQAQQQRHNRVTWAEGLGGSDTSGATWESEVHEQPIVYSVDMYRSTRNLRNKQPAPKVTIVRHSEHSHRDHKEEPLPPMPEKTVKERLQELQDMIHQEQSVIQQTSNALNQCCGDNSTFAGSAEAVECHRVLLIACKRRETYIQEISRIRGGHLPPAGQQGSLTISDIRLPIKKEFMSRIGTHLDQTDSAKKRKADNTVHYFICMIRDGGRVIVTQMMSTHDAMVRGTLDFPNLIKLNSITHDFRYEIEIYGMSVTRDPHAAMTPKKKSKGMTPKKLLGLGGSRRTHMQSPGGPQAVRTTNFTQVASLVLTKRCLGKTHFSLERVPFNSPLQGTIHAKLTCVMENPVEERGFLTMFEDVSGFGAWHRRWTVLKDNKLCFWKYPDYERIQEPIGYIDLKQCITDRVGLIPRDICARPNTFELVTVRRQSRGETDTLTTKCYNTMSTTRHQLSADTKEDRVAWCDQINEALKNLRTWHSDAMKPMKPRQTTDGGFEFQSGM